MMGWDDRYRPLVEGEIILVTDEIRRDDGVWVRPIFSVGMAAPDPNYTSHRKYRRLKARKMVSGDLFHRSPHTFDDAAWGGGRDDCKRCGVFLNSFYDDEDGCHGPWWMRSQDGGGRPE